MSPQLYSLVLKGGYGIVLFTSFMVIVNAVLSAKQMGGTLGQGLKKIATGTIFHTILILTYLLLEKGNRGVLTDEQVRIFFLTVGTAGSLFLILGYVQIYRISKRLKLFTI